MTVPIWQPRALVFGIVLALACAATARAHERSVSYSSWDIQGRRAQVTVRLSELEASRLPLDKGTDGDAALGAYLTQRLQLLADATPCVLVDGPRRLAGTAGWLAYEWRLACPDSGRLQVRSELLLDVAPSHLHFARVRLGEAEALERVLSDGERTWLLADAAAPADRQRDGTPFLGYLGLGIEHILTGYDHLAFLLALLLMQTSLLEVSKIVTGFTVAHSITLGLAVCGYVQPPAGAIEALIGLSIALVAAENVWLVSGRLPAFAGLITTALACLAGAAARGYGRVPPLTLAGLAVFTVCYFGMLGRAARTARLRWAVAFVFGLVHGFGFAAVLLDARLSAARLAQALFGFNLGVEIGQLAAVVLIWPLLAYAARPGRERWRAALLEVGSAAVCGLGVFWFVTRAFG